MVLWSGAFRYVAAVKRVRDAEWRCTVFLVDVQIGMQLLAPVLILALGWILPESPRWRVLSSPLAPLGALLSGLIRKAGRARKK